MRNIFNPSIIAFSTSFGDDSTASDTSLSSPFIPPTDKASRLNYDFAFHILLIYFFRDRKKFHIVQALRKTQKISRKKGDDLSKYIEATTTTFDFTALPFHSISRFSNGSEEELEDVSEADEDDVWL